MKDICEISAAEENNLKPSGEFGRKIKNGWTTIFGKKTNLTSK